MTAIRFPINSRTSQGFFQAIMEWTSSFYVSPMFLINKGEGLTRSGLIGYTLLQRVEYINFEPIIFHRPKKS